MPGWMVVWFLINAGCVLLGMFIGWGMSEGLVLSGPRSCSQHGARSKRGQATTLTAAGRAPLALPSGKAAAR